MSRESFAELTGMFSKIEADSAGTGKLSVELAVSGIIDRIGRAARSGNKVILVGNGGSASIASHITTDLLKNVKISALAFNDASLLTCLSNDLGYDQVFSRPIEMLANKDDILFCISSSGSSQNILNAAAAAKKAGCFIVTLSGFDADNPLRKMGDFNFYLPSRSYGNVEIIHLAICHAIVDKLMNP